MYLFRKACSMQQYGNDCWEQLAYLPIFGSQNLAEQYSMAYN
jgi:hypothetical protein